MNTPFDLRIRSADSGSGWRVPPVLNGKPSSSNLLVATHFVEPGGTHREFEARNSDDVYTLSVNFRRGQTIAFSEGRQFFSGNTQPGMVHIAQPGEKLRAVFLKPVDSFHLALPVRLLTGLLEESESSKDHRQVVLRQPNFRCDHGLFDLVKALAEVTSEGKSLDQLYAEGLCMAIVASVLDRYSNHPDTSRHVGRHGLRDWELKKLAEFVDDHIGGPISLLDLSTVVGLSRMHFASQFRLSTGLRPHEYVLQARIRKAKLLLHQTTLTVLDVALTVGFETQSHFSTVFKRIMGDTPARWRASS